MSDTYIARSSLGKEVVSQNGSFVNLRRGTEVKVLYLGDEVGHHEITVLETNETYSAEEDKNYRKEDEKRYIVFG